MTRYESTAVILCGGLSSRMRTPKHELFLDRIVPELNGFSKIALSVRDNMNITGYEFPLWPDIVKDCGPLGGIYTALKMSDTHFVFITPCDVPDITFDFIDMLFDELNDSASCVLPVVNAHVQPLTGIYSVSCVTVIEEALKGKDLSVKKFLRNINVHYVKISEEEHKNLRNVNTPEEYKLWLTEQE